MKKKSTLEARCAVLLRGWTGEFEFEASLINNHDQVKSHQGHVVKSQSLHTNLSPLTQLCCHLLLCSQTCAMLVQANLRRDTCMHMPANFFI
jgi:hypothetical protein